MEIDLGSEANKTMNYKMKTFPALRSSKSKIINKRRLTSLADDKRSVCLIVSFTEDDSKTCSRGFHHETFLMNL